MLHKKFPGFPPGTRPSKRGACTPRIMEKPKRIGKRSEPMCIFNREGNKAVPAQRMYKNVAKEK